MSCAFKGCTNSVHLCKESGLKFFKFPMLPFIRSKWLEACDGNEEVELAEVNEEDEFLQNIKPLNDIEFDGLENFAGYIVSKMRLKQFGSKTSETKQNNYTYVNCVSEGGLYKPSSDFVSILEHLNSAFMRFRANFTSSV